MRVYVASHCRWAGMHVSMVLVGMGHEVSSRWLAAQFLRVEEHNEGEREEIAIQDYEDVMSSDSLVLVAGPDRYPGGKFVEAGIALGAGKRVIVIGRRENMLMWHPFIEQVDTPEEAANRLLGR